MPDEPQPVYANYLKAHSGPFDVTLDFGYRIDPKAEPPAEVRIVMSWEHLSVALPILAAQLANYEKQLGPLPKLVADENSEEVS